MYLYIGKLFISKHLTLHFKQIPCQHDDISNGFLKPNVISTSIYVFICFGNKLEGMDICSFRNINCSTNAINYPNLKHLYLNNNEIKTLPEDLLISLTNLEKISLEYNHITHIPYYIFSNNYKIQTILLMHNKIKIFILELSHLLSLHTMSLYNNPLETIHEGTLKTFFLVRNTNKFIGLGNINIEQFKCDCNIKWIGRIKSSIVVYKFNMGDEIYNLNEFLEQYNLIEKNCNLNTSKILIDTSKVLNRTISDIRG